MKKIVSIFIILIIILLFPYILGQFIRYKVEEEVENLNQGLAPLVKQSTPIKLNYQSGWFNSTATITINNIIFNNQIKHTPYTLFKFASIKTTTIFPKNIAKPLSILFDNQQPYELITEIGFTGNTLFHGTSPRIDEKIITTNNDKTIINWQGLNLDAELIKNDLTYHLNLPKISLNNASGKRLLINNLQANTSQLTIKELAIFLAPLAIQIQDINATKNTIDTQNSYTLSLKQFDFQNKKISFLINHIDTVFKKTEDNTYQSIFNATPILIKNDNGILQAQFNYHNEQLLSTNQESINYSGVHEFSTIELPSSYYTNSLRKVILSYQIENLPQKQLIDLLKSYLKLTALALSAQNNKENKQIIEQQSEVNGMAINLAIATLRTTPKLILHTLINDNKGTALVDFQAFLDTPDTSSISIKKLQQNLVYRLNINFSVKVTKTLLNSVVQSASMGDSKKDQLKQLLQKLPMIESEDQYQINIMFKNNMFYVNGHYDAHFIQTYLPILKEYLF